MTRKDVLKLLGAAAVGSAIFLFLLLPGGDVESWEFLVRLEDKVNEQVFCLNPAHKGNHMDRFFFKDGTFSASCPDCSSDKFLYRKNNAITKKGHFITFKPAGWSWGTNERKHYGIIRVDCTYEQAQALCAGIKNEQAEADVIEYGNSRDLANLRLALYRAAIDYRPRAHKFDFESSLTSEQLSNWKDKDTYSEIVIISDLAEVVE